MNNVSFSILVPNLGFHSYLERCLDSIANQSTSSTFEYEVFLCDQSDNEIHENIKSFIAKKYGDVINVYHEDIKSLFLARLSLIKRANNNYIVMVDSDDMISKDFLKSLAKEIVINKEPDIVFLNNIIYIDEYDNELDTITKTDISNFELKKLKTLFYCSQNINSVWRKVFKKSLFYEDELTSNYRYIRNGEDKLFSHPLMQSFTSYFISNTASYFYRQHSTSITKTFDLKSEYLNLNVFFDNFNLAEPVYVDASIFKTSIVTFVNCYLHFAFTQSLNKKELFTILNFLNGKLRNIRISNESIGRRNDIIYKLFKLKIYRLLIILYKFNQRSKRKKKDVKKIIRLLTYFAKFKIAAIFAFFTNIFNKPSWFLFTERGQDAQDNAFIMYLYFLEKGHKCKYIINKKSVDAWKIRKENFINYDSFKHAYYLHKAKAIISTHRNKYIGSHATRFLSNFKLRAKFIFLQHGVILRNHFDLYFENFKCDLFLTSANDEYEYVKNVYHYPEDRVFCLGLPRHDFLFDEQNADNKILLIMPTFRSYCCYKTIDEFKKTTYFKQFQSLLTDPVLLSFCRNRNIQIWFYPHFETQKYIELFKVDSSIVRKIKYGEMSVLDILKQGTYLITDFSSVMTDFAYMKKQVYTFIFDEDEYYSKHYAKGYFDQAFDGFGPSSKNKENLILDFINSFQDYDSRYFERMNTFFKNKDCSNRERVYLKIIEIIEK